MPEQVAEAFGLGKPIGHLVPVQHTVSQTWRMTTDQGSYLVKQLWADKDPEWAYQLDDRKSFEQRASAAGIRTPRTVPAVYPAFGWTGRVAGQDAYRVTEWVEHRKVTDDDDLSDWLGRTLAVLHSFQTYGGDLELPFYLHPTEQWQTWNSQATEQGRPWAPDLADHLDEYVAIADRLRATFLAVDDHVITHRDMVPFNVLITGAGPVLTDWEVIGADSASLEAGFAAVTFGRRNAAYTRRILDSYTANGGALVEDLGENLFAHKLGSELGRLASMLQVALSGSPLRGWQNRYDDPDEGVKDLLHEVLATASRLRRLAAELGT